jgi:hypothetical protein
MLAAGSDSLLADYEPDTPGSSTYNSNASTTTVSVTATAPLTPTVTVTPSFNYAARAGQLPVTITVGGGSGRPAPTGSVTLISGPYSSTATVLVNGGATITVPPESLAVGYDSLTAVYAPDSASISTYNNTSGSSFVNVLDPVKSTPTITITPVSTSITPTQSLSVRIAVAGNNGFYFTTGSVTLSSGSYTSAPATLSANITTITIPAGSLAMGADTLTVTYTPDAQSDPVFFSATNTTTVTVARPSFSITCSTVTVMPGATSGNFSNIDVAPVLGFTGTVTLSAALNSNPTGTQYPPASSFNPTNVVTLSNGNGGLTALTITTTASTTAALDPSKHSGAPWYAAGGATLACILFFGSPKRRRWPTILGMLALLATLCGGVLSCGGGGSVTGGGGGGNSGTTAGIYTITVTGTSGANTASGTVTLNVQ